MQRIYVTARTNASKEAWTNAVLRRYQAGEQKVVERPRPYTCAKSSTSPWPGSVTVCLRCESQASRIYLAYTSQLYSYLLWFHLILSPTLPEVRTQKFRISSRPSNEGFLRVTARRGQKVQRNQLLTTLSFIYIYSAYTNYVFKNLKYLINKEYYIMLKLYIRDIYRVYTRCILPISYSIK